MKIVIEHDKGIDSVTAAFYVYKFLEVEKEDKTKYFCITFNAGAEVTARQRKASRLFSVEKKKE